MSYECPDCRAAMLEKRLDDRRGRHPAGAVARQRCPECGYTFWTDEKDMPLWHSAEPLLERYKREIERRKGIMRQYHLGRRGIATRTVGTGRSILIEAQAKGA